MKKYQMRECIENLCTHKMDGKLVTTQQVVIRGITRYICPICGEIVSAHKNINTKDSKEVKKDE